MINCPKCEEKKPNVEFKTSLSGVEGDVLVCLDCYNEICEQEVESEEEDEMLVCDECDRSLPEDEVIYCSCCSTHSCNDCNAEAIEEGGIDCGDREPYACPTCFAEMEKEKEEEESDEDEVVFCCFACEKEIIRNSEEHDNCVCDDDCENWTCADCVEEKEEEEREKEERKKEIEEYEKEIEESAEKLRKYYAPRFTCRECGAKNTIDDVLIVGFGVPKEYECCKCWSPKEWKRLEEDYYKK